MAEVARIRGFVLAGGKSSRMGRNKALMRLGQKTLVLRALETLEPFVCEVNLLAPPSQYGRLGVPVIADRWPNQGPLAAVCTALLHSDADWNIFLACDLPFVSRRFMELLAGRIHRTSSDAVVPRAEDAWQPLSAAYHARCRRQFVRAFEEGERSITRLLDKVTVNTITQNDMLAAGLSQTELTNVNTPEDWERIRRYSGQQDKSC